MNGYLLNFIPWIQINNLNELKIKKKDEDLAFCANKDDERWRVWHCILGHLSENNIKKIEAKYVEFRKCNNIQEFCES